MKFCGKCQEWIDDKEFPDHMKMENIGLNTDATEHRQYTGSSTGSNNYMICVLHQKKAPCQVKGCNYEPFGLIRKSHMMEYFKIGWWRWHDRYGQDEFVKIDIDTKIVVLFGVPIKLRI